MEEHKNAAAARGGEPGSRGRVALRPRIPRNSVLARCSPKLVRLDFRSHRRRRKNAGRIGGVDPLFGRPSSGPPPPPRRRRHASAAEGTPSEPPRPASTAPPRSRPRPPREKEKERGEGLAARGVDQQTPSHTPPTPPSAEGGLLKRPLSVRPGPGRSLESRAAGGRSAAPPFCKRGAATRVWRPTPGAEVPWARARRRPDDARGHHAPCARRYSPASRALALPAGRAAKTPRRAPPGGAGRPG